MNSFLFSICFANIITISSPLPQVNDGIKSFNSHKVAVKKVTIQIQDNAAEEGVLEIEAFGNQLNNNQKNNIDICHSRLAVRFSKKWGGNI